MFSTTMRYRFKPGTVSEAAEIWKNTIFNPALLRDGIVALELLINDNDEALAIGIWDDEKYAQEFMRTGIFKVLLDKLAPLLLEQPEAERWSLSAFGTVD